jgi:hypothetical protein
MIDLDQPICEGCRKPLAVIDHADGDDTIAPGKLNRWPDGAACYSCPSCRWEDPECGDRVPCWRTFAPELAGEIERLRAALEANHG